ncbi:serine/threonine protein kinase [Paenibacillus sp. GCM10012306]|uniref:serine/threonine protein kinase n=1 Tax=Paenibacillus sp. GCM10012306 TaxID=3317342 RepID=UPI003609E0AF
MRYPSKLAVGQLLGERYRVVDLIGSGGMSQVYLAEDLRLPGKWWAVKESVSPDVMHAAGDIEAEAELLISLNHPRLPRVTDFYPPDKEGYSYLVMDYIEGVTLSRYLELHPGPVPWNLLIQYALQLLEVLKYLHNQPTPIIYRDLKPSNIMLTGQHNLVLIDFGIARSYGRAGDGDTSKLGTVGFAAPEQYAGQSQPVSDLYGLGALLLYLATGGEYCSWEPGMESRLQGDVPPEFIPVLRRLLRQLPEERYPSAALVLEALASLDLGKRIRVEEIPERPTTCESEAVVVSLAGTANGLGTTHTSLAVAARLSRHGLTAWVDGSSDGAVFRNLFAMVQGQELVPADMCAALSFAWSNVHYWSSPGKGNSRLPHGEYSFIVLDLGTLSEEGDMEAFNHCDVPLLIASGADWRLGELLHWLRRRRLEPKKGWKVGLPLAGDSAAVLLQKALGTAEVFALPLQHDPFRSKGRLGNVLEVMLKEAIAMRRPQRRSALFRGKMQ